MGLRQQWNHEEQRRKQHIIERCREMQKTVENKMEARRQNGNL